MEFKMGCVKKAKDGYEASLVSTNIKDLEFLRQATTDYLIKSGYKPEDFWIFCARAPQGKRLDGMPFFFEKDTDWDILSWSEHPISDVAQTEAFEKEFYKWKDKNVIACNDPKNTSITVNLAERNDVHLWGFTKVTAKGKADVSVYGKKDCIIIATDEAVVETYSPKIDAYISGNVIITVNDTSDFSDLGDKKVAIADNAKCHIEAGKTTCIAYDNSEVAIGDVKEIFVIANDNAKVDIKSVGVSGTIFADDNASVQNINAADRKYPVNKELTVAISDKATATLIPGTKLLKDKKVFGEVNVEKNDADEDDEINDEDKVTENFLETANVVNSYLGLTEIYRISEYIKCTSTFLPETCMEREVKEEVMWPIQEILEKLKTDEVCPHCGEPLYKSDLPQYDYLCVNCEENFDECEV